MTYEFKLPDIGEGLTEGEIVKWHVKVGDAVAENQPIANVLTDKAEVEVPSPKAGKVVKLFAKPGEKVKVHAPLVTLELGAAAEAAPEKPKGKAPAKQSAPASPAPRSFEAGSGVYTFKLPDIGEGLTEGEIVKWHVKEGDTVSENQPLANVLTDKAEVEIPSPKAGKILKLYAKAGEKIKVHGPLADFALAGGAAAKPTTQQTPAAEAAHAAQPRTPAAPQRAAASAGPSRDVLATPMVRQLAKQLGVDLGLVGGSGPEGRVLEKDLRAYAQGDGASAPRAARNGGPVNATAAVKKLAAELGVDLSGIKGTGPGGRVAEWDVRKLAPASGASGAAAAGRPAPSAGGTARAAAAGPLAFSAASAPSSGEERTPL